MTFNRIRCSECGCFHDHPSKCPVPALRAAFVEAGIKVTERDEQMIRWFAGWGSTTAEWLLSVVKRLAERAAVKDRAMSCGCPPGDYRMIERDGEERPVCVQCGEELEL